MSILSAYLGVAGLLDVGYRLYDGAESPLAARVTAGITDAGGGWYSADVTIGAAESIRWDSTGTAAAVAREYNLQSYVAQGRLDAAVSSRSTLTAAQVDTQLSGTHGAGSWEADPATGAYTVTVTVTDGTDPIPNARVRLTEGVDTFVKLTDALGVAEFSLDAATYGIAITKSGYTFTPDSIAVTGDGNFDEEVTATVIPTPPANPLLCTVYGYLFLSSGAVAASKTVVFTLSSSVPASAGGMIFERAVEATTDADGYLEVDLIRNDEITPAGSAWLVTSEGLHADRAAIVLAAETFDLTEMVQP